MEKSSSEPLRLDAFHNQNWNASAGPVAFLNEASTMHERIAYCWGLSSQIGTVAHILSTSEDANFWRYGQLLDSFSIPLVAMLERLAGDTAPESGNGTLMEVQE